MKKTLICAVVVSAMLLAFTSCGNTSNGNGNGGNSGTTSLTGNDGGNDSGSSSSSSSGGSSVETEKIPASQRKTIDGKLGTYQKPYAPGDLIFDDGSAEPITSDLNLSEEQKEHAIAVIFFVGKGLNSDNTGTQESRTLGVGLKHSAKTLMWASSSANGYKVAIDPIKCPSTGSAPNYVFTGDRNGSDNLSQMSKFLKNQSDGGVDDDTANDSLYPAFHWAKNYKNTFVRLVGTDYEDGWYLPSIAELCGIGKYLNYVDLGSSKCELTEFGKSGRDYWSSTDITSNTSASYMSFDASKQTRGSSGKSQSMWVCAIREF